jgi:hypothetical protein
MQQTNTIFNKKWKKHQYLTKFFLPGWGIEPSVYWSKVLFYIKILITLKIQLKSNQTEKLN